MLSTGRPVLNRARYVKELLVAQQHLGERANHMVRCSKKVDCKAMATAAGYSNVSRWGADLFAREAGLTDEILGPDRPTDQEALLPNCA